MDEDDPKPQKPAGLEPRILDRLSIEELREYIDELKAEIARTEADIARKQAVRAGAEAFFKK
ncbi:MAG: DUF1192 family protein [Alphaproteobacteria bacterium]|nr:DUF1192 family protein [Alphaproteobacteria bacterium]